MEGEEVNIVTGKRSDGSLFLAGGYVYSRNTIIKGHLYLKCTDGLCSATGVLRCGESRVRISKNHNHLPIKADEEVVRYRDSIRKRAVDLSRCDGFRNIFDSESASYPVGSLLRGFPQDEQLMRRSRNTCMPPLPRDLHHLNDILNFQPQWRNMALAKCSNAEFFRETVVADDDSLVSVLVSPYFADLLVKDGAELFLDATFDVRPQYPETEQLLSIHVCERDDVDGQRYIYPCAYALMQRKTEAAYVASLKATNDAVGGRMNPSTAMGDYEKGLHNALRSLHPHIETSGCWFHYCNAISGAARSAGLTDEQVVNEAAERNVMKLMALPLLPPGEIVNGLTVIEEDLKTEGLTQSFKPVIDNLKDYWLNDNKVGVDMLSVFELDSRTNNSVESSHFQLYRKLRLSRPNFWNFYDALRNFDYARHQDRQRLLRNVATRRARRQSYIVQDANIRDMQKKLSDGDLLVEDFLARACHCVEGLQKRLKKKQTVE